VFWTASSTPDNLGCSLLVLTPWLDYIATESLQGWQDFCGQYDKSSVSMGLQNGDQYGNTMLLYKSLTRAMCCTCWRHQRDSSFVWLMDLVFLVRFWSQKVFRCEAGFSGGLKKCSCVIGILKQFWCSFRHLRLMDEVCLIWQCCKILNLYYELL
jgi:hypothetical protein